MRSSNFEPLLDPLDIKGRLVTADALHTQRRHAVYLVEKRGADYLFYAEGNQPKLYQAISTLRESAWSKPYTECSKGHGRIERRTIWTSTDLPEVDFPHAHTLVRILTEVDDAKTGKPRYSEVIYAVSSARARRAALLHASRGHWGIEAMHWVRDAMGEDASKVRSGSAPRIMATLRSLTISVLRLAGVTNIAKGRRYLSRRPRLALGMLGL